MTRFLGINGKPILIAIALGAAACGLANPKLAGAQPPTTQDQKNLPPKDHALVDLYGDPLPAGAMARLGTERFRHGSLTSSLAYALDGKVLVSGGGIGFGVCILDAETGRPLHRVRVPLISFHLAVSPDGKTICTSYLNLIDVATGKEIRRFGPPPNTPHCVVFSPDGLTVAAAQFFRGNLTLLDVTTGKELRDFGDASGGVGAMAFSPNGKILVSAGLDNAVRFWDVASGKELRRFEAHERSVSRLAFAPDGKVLAMARDKEVELWDVATGKVLQRLKSDETADYMVFMDFSPDGKILASTGGNGAIWLWDPATGKQLRHWQAHTSSAHLAFSPDGKTLASRGSQDATIRRWDVASGKEIGSVAGHTGGVLSLSFAPDGKTLISHGRDQKFLEWDVASSRERDRFFAGPFRPPGADQFWTDMRTSDLAPDGLEMALVGYRRTGDDYKPDLTIYLYDTLTGKQRHALSGHTEQVSSLKFSPDGKLLLSTAKDGVYLWDVSTGKMQWHLKEQSTQIAFSPTGKLLVMAGPDRSIRICEVATGKEIRRWDSQLERVFSLVFSPDGTLLASLGRFERQSTVRIWSTASGKELHHIAGLPTTLLSVVFSPSGRVLAGVGSVDRKLQGGDVELITTIHFLEVLTGQEIRQFECLQGDSPILAFAPDGRTLASGGGDSTIMLWDVTGAAQAGKLKPAPLTAKDLDRLWPDLRGDAPAADRAIWALALAPKQSMPFLREQLRPVAPGDAQQIAKHLADLGSERFAMRQKAAQALDALGEAAEKAVRKALEGNITLEVRQRVELFLQKRGQEELRKLRAIEVLEHIATAEARQVLETLAKDSPNPRVAEGAAAALLRLGKRKSGIP